MTAATSEGQTSGAAVAARAAGHRKVTSTRVLFAVPTIICSFLFFFRPAPHGTTTTYRLATDADFFQLPSVTVGSRAVSWSIGVALVAITIYAIWKTRSGTPRRSITIGFSALAVFGFLTWAAAEATIPVPGLLVGTVALSVPLVFGAMSGVIGERVGVVNIAIEGQLLAGAFVSAVVASATQNAYAGLVAAAFAGVAVAWVLVTFSIKYYVDQIIVGVVLNVLVIGLTNFLYSQVLTENPELFNSPPVLSRINIPVLSSIPIIGPALFRQTVIVYAVYLAVAFIWFGLFKTRWGLRLRSVGEHPRAADTVGIDVNRTRFWNVLLAGAIAGFGGAYFTLGSVGQFGKVMTAGAGFIALAAVIFGRWDPLRAAAAALLFGFTAALQSVLGIVGSPMPSEFLLMLPYVVTVFAVAGLVGEGRAPAAAGKAYIKQ